MMKGPLKSRKVLVPVAVGVITVAILISCSRDESSPYTGLPGYLITSQQDSVLSDTIVYHPVRLDHGGKILPWYSAELGESYDHVLKLVWQFWKQMDIDSNGMAYYMNHQVWDAHHDKRGLGGDQIMMGLSSWDLYYNYTGDETVLENMKYMADYYLAHALSPPDSKWPNLPFPYNMNVESGVYDGDMILGKNYLQPDKAGSFGFELIHLYKKTGNQKYLDAAISIAKTLTATVQPGDNDHSPWPFKVNAVTGETGVLTDQVQWYEGMDQDLKKTDSSLKRSSYTTNWTGTLGLFHELRGLNQGASITYQRAYDLTLNWLKQYPAKTNKWGPFFEDIPRWSDTQINAITYAMFLLEHPEADSEGKQTVRNIFAWVHKELDNTSYNKYGVIPTDEQTAYRQPGNSHSARQASAELRYWEISGDTTYVVNAIRQLNWATYMVDHDGKNFYPTNAVWMTDGYGDYVRHYLRAMAAAPQLAPEKEAHILRSSSIVKQVHYQPSSVSYTLFDDFSHDVLRLPTKPESVTVNGVSMKPVSDHTKPGWIWQPLTKGGILRIYQEEGNKVEINY